MNDAPGASIQLHVRRGSSARAGPDRMRLLRAIRDLGSISAAAKAEGLSYKGAWDSVQALNNLFAQPLVTAQPGGASGGTAVVTQAGLAVLAAYQTVEAELTPLMNRLEEAIGSGEAVLNPSIWRLGMKTSARNALHGVVEQVTEGAVNSEVTLRINDQIALTAIITRESVADLGLATGREALALIKSSFVILATGDEVKTSARNQISGIVVRHEVGAVNDEVVLDLGDGKSLTATITSESAKALGITVGVPAWALIKASHVILAVD